MDLKQRPDSDAWRAAGGVVKRKRRDWPTIGCLGIVGVVFVYYWVGRSVGFIPAPTPEPNRPAATVSAEDRQALYRDCITSGGDSGHSIARTLDDCESQRPSSLTRATGCTMYVISEMYYDQGYSKAETEVMAASLCSGY